MKDSQPLVSIIIPVFNGEEHLRESLDSIVNQTYPGFEILVMDDASTDGTGDIVKSYGGKIQYFRQAQNRGIYRNMNDGIIRANGEFIAFYHADDIYDQEIVAKQVAFFRQYPETGAVFTEAAFIDGAGRAFGRFKVQPELRGNKPFDYNVIFNALLTYKNRFLICPCNMTRTAVYKAVGVYRQDKFLNSSDLDMWLRISQKYPIGIIEESLINYRNGHNSSAKRYHHLRTDMERYFTIMDLYLGNAGHEIAAASSLAAYEAHRQEDRLMRAINYYILGQHQDAQNLLHQVKAGRLLASNKIQRLRLLTVLIALQCLTRLPKIRFIADLFYRRWHAKHGIVVNPALGK